MRITGGDNPLDATSVHPESYEACEKLLLKLGLDKTGLTSGNGLGKYVSVLTSKMNKKKAAKQAAEATVNAYKRKKIDTTDDKSIDVYATDDEENKD